MQRIFLGLKIAVPVVVLAFVALVVFGVYTALDSATSQYASAAESQTAGVAAEQLIERASFELGVEDCSIDEEIDITLLLVGEMPHISGYVGRSFSGGRRDEVGQKMASTY